MQSPDTVAHLSMRKRASLRRRAFYDALLENGEIGERNERVSLESAFIAFIHDPVVIAYYTFTPLIAELLDSIKGSLMKNDAFREAMEVLLRETSNCGLLYRDAPAMKRLIKEIKTQLERIHLVIEELVRQEWLSGERGARGDVDSLIELLRHYWIGQRDAYLSRTTGFKRLSQLEVLQELLGFNMSKSKETDPYYTRWTDVIASYLSEKSHHHMHIIGALDQTEQELLNFYAHMNNMVSFKSLVMITMWRYHREKGTKSILEALYADAGATSTNSEDHAWTLAYGTFVEDYRIFLEWHHHGIDKKPIHMNLYYIDFDASSSSAALHIDMGVPVDHLHAYTSFAALFTHHVEPLHLSYMRSPGDTGKEKRVVPIKREQQYQEEEEEEEGYLLRVGTRGAM